MIDNRNAEDSQLNIGTDAFADFRDHVAADFALLTALRSPLRQDAYVSAVVDAGAALGFVFDEGAVWTALRQGEARWLASDDPP